MRAEKGRMIYGNTGESGNGIAGAERETRASEPLLRAIFPSFPFLRARGRGGRGYNR